MRDMTSEIAPASDGSIAPSIAGDEPAPETAPRPHAGPLDHAAVRTIVAGIMLAMFLSALEQTIVAPALPAIGKSLGDIDHLSWVVTAYLLAVTATTPLFGKLSDIYGRRVVLLLGDRHFHRRFGRLRAGAKYLDADPRAWPARHRRRRPVADRADHHRRSVVAARTPGRAGPHLDHVHERQHSRSGARRIADRSSALVVDFLDQPAARRGRADHDRARVAARCRATSGRTNSTCSAPP